MEFDQQCWEALKKAALLGTDRVQLPDRVQAILTAQGISPALPPQRIVLEGAALFHQLRRTATAPASFSGTLPPAPAAEERRYLERRSAYHLELILEGRFRRALPEFIQLLIDQERQLPPESLPALFEQALAEPSFWRTIEPAVGPVGHWLIARHPQWRALAPPESITQWSTGTSAQRKRLFAHLRQTDPARASALLASDWKQLDFRERAAFLDLFTPTLSPADEAFLEHCLDDRRQEVRRRAAALLARLEEADLPKRLFKQMNRHLQMAANGTLRIELPRQLDAPLIRDGILEKSPADRAVGRKEGWLLQMLARIPPDWWVEQFEKPPAACIRLFAQAGRPEHWLPALAEAALRYRAGEWMEALLAYWQESGLAGPWKNSLAERLMDTISGEAFHRLVLGYLHEHGQLPPAGSLLAHLLTRRQPKWSESLSREFIRALQEWLSEQPSATLRSPVYREQLEAAAYHSNPELLDVLRRGWPVQAASWRLWEKEVENFLNTLLFRREMRHALA